MVKGKPGVEPQLAKREQFARQLIGEGLSIAEAARRVEPGPAGGGCGVGRSACPRAVRASMTW